MKRIPPIKEGLFGQADEMWMPTLLDLEMWKTSEDVKMQEYFGRFGWENLVIPEDCPNVTARMETLRQRFDDRFGTRMLGYETLEIWQVKLQRRMDEVVHRMEKAYVVYGKYEQNVIDDVLAGERIETVGGEQQSGSDKSTAGGSDSTERKGKVSDTPDASVNESDNFAGTVSKDRSTNTYGRTDTVNYGRKIDSTVTQTRTQTGGVVLENMNAVVDSWEDIDTVFMTYFENLFLNIFW